MIVDGIDIRDTPVYHYSLQETLEEFLKKYGKGDRKTLFIFGHGFDPRCYPALEVICRVFAKKNYSLTTFCARFTNLLDKYLADNKRYSRECLDHIRSTVSVLSGPQFKHYEVEVNLFSVNEELIGESLLIAEFADCLETSLSRFTDIIVDVSAFPRSLMYTLVAYLWKRRIKGQNLFIAITELEGKISESNFHSPSFVRGEKSVSPNGRNVWIPVLGGDIGRFKRIYDFLKPVEIYPIIFLRKLYNG